MMMRLASVSIALMLGVAALPTYAKQTDMQKAEAILRRPPSYLESIITVRGDRLDPRITVSTSGATQDAVKTLFGSIPKEESFLRAFINRQTGEVSAQIYHVAEYGGTGWNFFRRATYTLPEGLQEAEAITAGTDVSCQRYGCWHTEELIIPVPFAALEAKAAAFNPASPFNGIAYRLFGQSGVTIDGIVPENEIVAFVNVVNRNRPKDIIAPITSARPSPVALPSPDPKAKVPPSPRPTPTVAPRPGNIHVRCITC